MTDLQIKVIQAIQDGIPISSEPFRDISERIGISQGDMIDQLKAWKEDGTIRRFGAILRHHQAGYSVNAMGVWSVPDSQIDDFGQIAACHQ
ncbi:MAG: Lrp/AsnC family transcriptional regulator, partial [Armatimonadota bacterium]